MRTKTPGSTADRVELRVASGSGETAATRCGGRAFCFPLRGGEGSLCLQAFTVAGSFCSFERRMVLLN
jgi:hypothetical protein